MIFERARAKLNLTLRVLGRREDGYHEIDSLIAFAENACDDLAFIPCEPAAVTVSGPFGHCIVGENIVETALKRLAETCPGLTLGSVHIEKNLPVAAGIGGGSANTGALLRAVAAANPGSAEEIDWKALATSLGADVPACFANIPCRATALGEQLEPLGGMPTLNAVLVNAMADVPADKTARVFRLLAAPPLRDGTRRAPTPAIKDAGDLLGVMSEIGNDLEPAARQAFPEIASILNELRATEGCRFAAMSGAGPTCFGIFDDNTRAATTLRARHPDWWIKATKI